MNTRLFYTVTVFLFLITIGILSVWYVTILTFLLAIICTMFGIEAKRQGWVL